MALRKEEFHYNPYDREIMERTKAAKKRITISISLERYNQIKTEAYQHNQSISEYVGEMLNQTLPAEVSMHQQAKHLTPEIVENMLAARKKIQQDTRGWQFEDSTELIRQMRLERSEELDQR